jgi:D-alanyl-lipoteichoic acid acyltransferase DltB (MBOAT superfamily)
MWQDTIIALCQLAFLPSMLPTVFGKDKPAFSTSVMNAVIVAIIATTMATLHLWFSVITSSAIVLVWVILAVQKRPKK